MVVRRFLLLTDGTESPTKLVDRWRSRSIACGKNWNDANRVEVVKRIMRHLRQQKPFEEKRELWRSKLDKPIGPGLMITLIPTLIMCVFLVMAAPYLKSILLKFFEMDQESVIVPISLAEDGEPVLPDTPPPNPEIAIAEIYQRQFDEEGFDWRKPPELEFPEETPAKEIEKEIKPVPVDIPLSASGPEFDPNLYEVEQ